MINKADFNSEIAEVEGKILNISGLTTSYALTAVENKIPDVSGLAATSALTAVKNKIPGVTSLVAKTDFDAKLKAVSDRVTKTFDLSYFRGKNYFEDSGPLIYLIFQPIDKCFKSIVGVGNGEYISFWKSRGLSDEKINSITASNHIITLSLDYLGPKIRVKFNGSCLKQDKTTYTHRKIVNIYIVYETSKNYNISSYPTLENCLFGAVSLIKNADIDNYEYSGYGIGFDRLGEFSFGTTGFDRNVIIFGADMSSSVHGNNKKNNILVLGKEFIQGINGTTIYAEKMYSINFTANNKKFVLSFHYNGDNSYLFVNSTEIHKFKAKDSEIVATQLCLRNISKDFSVDNMKITGLNGYVYDFSADYDAIANDEILDIHKYLMEKNGVI